MRVRISCLPQSYTITICDRIVKVYAKRRVKFVGTLIPASYGLIAEVGHLIQVECVQFTKNELGRIRVWGAVPNFI